MNFVLKYLGYTKNTTFYWCNDYDVGLEWRCKNHFRIRIRGTLTT